MLRSPNTLPSTQGETTADQQQVLLFATSSTDEDETDMKVPIEEKTGTKSSTRAKKHANYSAADIQVLEGIAAIRHRPGMYIGSTSTSGLIHLIWEALDNAVDEAVAGFGKHIWVSIERDGSVTVS